MFRVLYCRRASGGNDVDHRRRNSRGQRSVQVVDVSRRRSETVSHRPPVSLTFHVTVNVQRLPHRGCDGSSFINLYIYTTIESIRFCAPRFEPTSRNQRLFSGNMCTSSFLLTIQCWEKCFLIILIVDLSAFI